MPRDIVARPSWPDVASAPPLDGGVSWSSGRGASRVRTRRRTARTPLDGGCGARAGDGRLSRSGGPEGAGQTEVAWADDLITSGIDAPPDGDIHARKWALKICPGAQKWRSVRRMLIIAVGIALALVAVDFLDLARIRKS
ncbi:MAG: hypothetical protein IT372_19190 [Polyangiaceae bacterium]|nr:hypothetical protein [Polyangiaceae bacterium]